MPQSRRPRLLSLAAAAALCCSSLSSSLVVDAFVSPTQVEHRAAAATALDALPLTQGDRGGMSRRSAFGGIASALIAGSVVVTAPPPAHADVTNKVASSSAIRGVKRAIKDLEKVELPAASNDYVEVKAGLRTSPMNDVRKNCLVIVRGGEDGPESQTLVGAYDDFKKKIEALDSQAGLGVRGKKNIEMIPLFDAALKSLVAFEAVAEKSALIPLQDED